MRGWGGMGDAVAGGKLPWVRGIKTYNLNYIMAPSKPPEPPAAGMKMKMKMKRFTIDLPEELHRRIKTGCAAAGIGMADWVRKTLEKNLPVKA